MGGIMPNLKQNSSAATPNQSSLLAVPGKQTQRRRSITMTEKDINMINKGDETSILARQIGRATNLK